MADLPIMELGDEAPVYDRPYVDTPKQPIVNNPAAMATTKNRIAAWWTMNRMPTTMSFQMAWMRLLDDPGGAWSVAGRLMATDPIRLAETRKLATSMA